jgi:hypothetical protein
MGTRALLVTVSEPERAPVAIGLKMMPMTQEYVGASEVPQLFVCQKSPVA